MPALRDICPVGSFHLFWAPPPERLIEKSSYSSHRAPPFRFRSVMCFHEPTPDAPFLASSSDDIPWRESVGEWAPGASAL